MRLKLTLQKADGSTLSPNYFYSLSSAIYKLLHLGSHEFASFLHDIGYKLNGRTYKLFCFAMRFDSIKIINGEIHMLEKGANLYITSPLIEEFIRNFIIGTFEEQKIEISDSRIKCTFIISQVQSQPEPDFQEINYFKMLSPMVLSTVEERDNNLHQHFFRYNEDINEINRVFNQNLKNKYKLLYNSDYTGDDLILIWDKDYITKKLAEGKRLTKKISITKNDERPVEIIANEIPFTLSGNKELIKVGYECGFGEKNSMGFGLGETISN